MANIRFNEVVDSNMVVNSYMDLHKKGTLTYEEALEQAIVELVDQNKDLFAKLLDKNRAELLTNSQPNWRI